MTWKFWVEVGIRILGAIIKVVSPEIREAGERAIKEWYEKAKQTDNPWDDYLVELIASLLGFKLE